MGYMSTDKAAVVQVVGSGQAHAVMAYLLLEMYRYIRGCGQFRVAGCGAGRYNPGLYLVVNAGDTRFIPGP